MTPSASSHDDFAGPESARAVSTSRMLRVPREDVLRAFRDPERLARWWGPKGFTSTVHAFEFRAGGEWRFTLHAPDGKDYANEITFAEIAEPERIVLQHVSSPRFELTITLDEVGGKTRIGWRQVFETTAVCEQLKPLVVQANEQNLDKLEVELGTAR